MQQEKETLQKEKQVLQRDLQRQATEHEDMRKAVATAMAAAEKAMAMHAFHAQHVEQLRAAKLEDVLKKKVELHISVPRITLNYNNAPPLQVSAATALSEDKVRSF